MRQSLAVKGLSALSLVALIALVVSSAISSASTPPEHTVGAPNAPGTVTVTWTGTIPAGVHPTSGVSDCTAVPNAQRDNHVIHLQIPGSFYDNSVSTAEFNITWDNAQNDEILTVEGPNGVVGSSDGGEPSETVAGNDLPAGDYTVRACPFGLTGGGGVVPTTPQDYTGRLTFTSSVATPGLPSVDPQGLSFSASVPADPQRDEAEPDIRIDGDGNIYTCGPDGFSNASDYAQVSTDGGDQFHLLGEEPRGQQGLGGGGDCGLAMGVRRNAQGNFQYAYSGLGPLTGFTTSTSADNGHEITNAGPQGNTNTAQGGGADRQWLAFLDDHTVLMSYNQQQPRNVVVQKSTDGGLTYLPGNDAIAAPNPDFPGPIRSMPARFVDPNADPNAYIAYFGWNASDANNSYVNFAISDTTGLVWKNCLVETVPAAQGTLGAFTVADNDNQGNIYLTYADKGAFHSYLTTLTRDKLAACNEAPTAQPTTDPGWSNPVQVDRNKVRSTVFPWLAASGVPGRVAVAFYGTESDGDPNQGSFKASWDVYVNQSLDALSANPTFSQVKATTHPFHYDSICLNGLGCDVAQPPGDRSLADFFAIAYNPADGRLNIVYDQGAKKPDDAVGTLATPAVITQEGGPSNGGGFVTPRRPAVRKSSDDHTGDAIADYSSLNRASDPVNVPAMDFLSQTVGAERNLENGEKIPAGGFNVTLKLDKLTDAALDTALDRTGSRSLLFIFRFVNGYQASAAVARWSPSEGFTFGFNDYTIADVNCPTPTENCQVYPGDQELKGQVDQEKGTIEMRVPRDYLVGLNGPTGPGQRPTLDKATEDTRFYDATAFSLSSILPDPSTQSFLYPVDNPPAMDFRLGDSPPATGAACSNKIKGTKKKDKLKGTKGPDTIRGRGGNDKIKARGGDDCASGQGGKDRVSGGAGDDTIKGGRGKDRLSGGGGNDKIKARRGARDRINCGKGKDVAIVNKKRDKVKKNCEKVRKRG